jgi:hypothetical protein
VEPRAAQGVVMSGGAKGPFYRPAWRRREAGNRWWSLTPPISKSKKGEGSRWGVELVRGKRRRLGGKSFRLLTRTGGWPTTASGGSVGQGGRRPERAGPEWAEAGPRVGPATKNPRKMENGMPTWFGPKSELGCIFDSEFYFKDLSLKSKVSNTFKPNLN